MNQRQNEVVYHSEISLSKASNLHLNYKKYTIAYNCKLKHDSKSHLIFLVNPICTRESPKIQRECEHKHYIINPLSVENLDGSSFYSYAMHLEYPFTTNRSRSDQFSLNEINSQDQWDQYEKHRYDIEKAFSAKPQNIQSIISMMKYKLQKLNGAWYLFKHRSKVVGAIGLFTMHYKSHFIGRLQDVDILPAYQGLGYGTQLLLHTIDLSKSLKHHSISLCCDAGEWPKKFYESIGFKQVGTWEMTPN